MNHIAKLSDDSTHNIGRIGGNIPENLISNVEELKDYIFYMTFQNFEDKNEYLSIFVHKSFDVRIDQDIYPNIAVKVFQHSESKESDVENFTAQALNISFIAGYDNVKDNVFGLITFSKKPKLLQEESYYFNGLNKEGFRFLAQIDEDFYTATTLKGSYLFAYGALYLFQHQTKGSVVAGFWQH